jgi:hypothetical protein
MKDKFTYESVDIIKKGKDKTVRKVSVKNGKGYKSVSKFKNGKHVGTAKKKIMDEHISLIKGGTFIKDLFGDCKCGTSKKTRKYRN